MPRRRRRPLLAPPLARWGFTVCALFAYTTGQTAAAVVLAVVAAAAWRYA